MNDTFEFLRGKLIVSCQADGNEPFNRPEYLLLFAKAALNGGASGIRTEGYEKTKYIKQNVSVPVIGLKKSKFIDGTVRITGSIEEVEKLMETGCDIIAVDGTFREREGLNGPLFITEIKKRFPCQIMADISTYSEGIACYDYGADCISTTLSGYTPDTQMLPKDEPDYKLVSKLSKSIPIPVIAEGKINQPKFAKHMLEYGAWAVVVGTAITRPHTVTNWFVEEMKKAVLNEN